MVILVQIVLLLLAIMPRIPESIKKPTDILSGRGAIGRIYRQARGLIELQDQIRAIIPGDIYAASFENGSLHLVTPSAALATKLKYSQRKLIGALKLGGVRDISISVRPQLAARYEPEPATRKMSEQASRHIADMASYIEDEELREAIIRLSGHAGEP